MNRQTVLWKLMSVLATLAMLVQSAWLSAPPPAAQAFDTGWRNPTGDQPDAVGDGNGFEQFPTDAYADGGQYARNMNGFGDRHRYYDYGFTSLGIPADAVITGIEVRLDGWVDSILNDPRYQVELSWNGESNWTSARQTPILQNTEASYTLGGPDDRWGRNWSIGELTNFNFSLRITSLATGVGRANRDFFLDWVAVRIYYATARIDGTIWSDDNGNGVQDGSEAGLANVRVTVYRDDGDGVFEGGAEDPEMDFDDSGLDGYYITGPFLDGYSYWVDVSAPLGYSLTTPPEPRLVSLPDGNSANVDFGYQPGPPANPAIAIAKTPDAQMVVSGSSVTFTIAVTNTGDVPLAATVSDALVPDCNRAFALLTVGQSQRYTCALINVTADFTNTVLVTGTPAAGAAVTSSDTAFVDVINPDIQIAKSPDLQTVTAGSTVTFTIDVVNTGDVALSSVTVSDPLTPSCARSYASLAPGARQSYLCSLIGASSDFTNVASVAGAPPAGNTVGDSDSAQVRVVPMCAADTAAHWPLNENSGPTYADVRAGHDAACSGGKCPVATSGQVGGAQSFDGVDDELNVPAHADFDWGAGDSLAVELWTRTNLISTCAGNQVIVGRNDPASQLHWWVGCAAGGQAAFFLRNKSGQATYVQGATDLTDGNWHHVLAMRDASANVIRLYVDGVLDGSSGASYTSGFDAATAGLNIGWFNVSPYFHFNGVVDEVGVLKTALSAGEVRQHYVEGLAGHWFCEAADYVPIIVSEPIAEAVAGQPYSYTVEAAGNPDPTFSLATAPGGMTIDATSGAIAWTPASGQVGTHTVAVQASNAMGIDTQSFDLEVKPGGVGSPNYQIYLPVILSNWSAPVPLAHWKLDETSGSSYADAIAGHNGVCSGQCPAPAAGIVNGGQSFNGSSTGINVPAHTVFNWGGRDSFSLEFWMKTDSASTCAGNQVAIGRDDASTELHWWSGCLSGGRAAFYLQDRAGTVFGVEGITDLTDGSWHRVVAVRDGLANQLRIYVDGVHEGTMSAAYTTDFNSATVPLNIGWLNLVTGFRFAGVIDEVAVYSGILSR